MVGRAADTNRLGEDAPKKTSETSLDAARKTFTTKLVAICLNPTSAGVGYSMNRVLQRPDLQIVYLNESYVIESHKIEPSITKSILNDKLLSAKLRDVILRTSDPSGPQCVAWLDGKAWTDDCLSRVRDNSNGLLNAYRAELDILRANVEAIKARTPSSNSAPRLLPSESFRPELLFLQVQKDKQGVIEMLSGPSAVLENQVALLQNLIDAFSAMGNYDTPRTGELTQTAGVLNAGDADGVVANRASLAFEKGKIWMAANPNAWAPIKAHSFQEVTLAVGGDEDGGKSVEALMSAVLANQMFDVTLTLNTNAKLSRPTFRATLSQ
jgi:hypothetical protein